MIVCEKRGCMAILEKDLDLHHIIPKAFGGVDSDGRIYLCKKHHDILHKMLLEPLWAFIPEHNKELCKQKIKGFTKWYLNKNG